jgi:hypothetical protein
MTAVTIAGIACAERDVGAHYHRSGRLAKAESFNEIDLSLPDEGVALDLDHDHRPIGKLVHGEVDLAGRLGLVCVVDDGDWLLDYDGPVYYSPEMLLVGPGVHTRSVAIADTAALVSIGLTTDPATVAALPVHVLAGDVRSAPDRATWPMSWRSAYPLVARALDHVGDSYRAATRTPRRLVDQRGLEDQRNELRLRATNPWRYQHGPATQILR